MDRILKYPRTPHLQGSRWQPGDEDLEGVPLSHLDGRWVVVEEKLDGANCALSFDDRGELRLQSRGHFLTGGPRERHFALLKSWAQTHRSALFEVLGMRYQMFGEWLYAKHTIFYDQLPHYFLEFDIWDRERESFLDTVSRHRLLGGSPVRSVPVLHQGELPKDLNGWVRPSLYKSKNCRERLRQHSQQLGLDGQRVEEETDPSPLSEGLYLKWEADGQVAGRYKFVRASFLTAVVDSESHWQDRPILPNLLAEGCQLFPC